MKVCSRKEEGTKPDITAGKPCIANIQEEEIRKGGIDA
jgi:hypothetical protein